MEEVKAYDSVTDIGLAYLISLCVCILCCIKGW